MIGSIEKTCNPAAVGYTAIDAKVAAERDVLFELHPRGSVSWTAAPSRILVTGDSFNPSRGAWNSQRADS